ncbi:unnamed protein product [Arctia plantaginis]|uniref:Uncharacterized protein n=1 Tax=Arctia plantaginis TaxID=874455 RepID=A0A8S1BFI3_ARCPL|nr:unnamed protein product [Arctia plantaginis]
MFKVSQHHEYAYRRRLRRRPPQLSKIDILKASVKTVSKEYCQESSICGLKHLVDDTTPFIERLVWIIMLVVSVGCSIALVQITFNKFYSAPLVTTQLPDGIPVDNIIFPAVGLCTNNRISKQAVSELAKSLLKEERNKQYNENEMMTLLAGLGQLYGMSMNVNNVSPIALHNALGEYDVHELMRKLQFSDAYDFPDSPSGSFAMQIVSPSVQVSASFTKASRDIQHVPISLRKCRFYDESSFLSFYTYSDCMLKCRMLFLLDRCNCTPFNMPKINTARTCNMKDVQCLKLYYSQSIAVQPINVETVPEELELNLVNGGIDCPMCYPTCSKTTYGYDFNNVVIYPEFLNTVPDSDRDDWL